MKTKICNRCGIEKDIEAFNRCSRYKDGFRYECKTCRKPEIRKYTDQNKDRIHEYSKKRYHENREKHLAASKLYYEEHKEERKAYLAKYHKNNKERASQLGRLRRQKPEVREKDKRTRAERYKNNPVFRFRCKLTRNLQNRLSVRNAKKRSNMCDLIGCSVIELMSHLEKQFSSGMNWENRGYHGWHIDHILPCDSFNLTLLEEQQKCFHWSNLQPLWKDDNLSKSNHIIHEREWSDSLQRWIDKEISSTPNSLSDTVSTHRRSGSAP